MRWLILAGLWALACGGNTEDVGNSPSAGSPSVGGTSAGAGGRGSGGAACGPACVAGSGGSSVGPSPSGGASATGGAPAQCGTSPSCSNLSCASGSIPFCDASTNSCVCSVSCVSNPAICGMLSRCQSVCDPSGACACIGSCVTEGQIGIYAGCCAGLTSIPYYPSVAPCGDPSGQASYVCTACGNNVCGLGENHCNCPNDCP